MFLPISDSVPVQNDSVGTLCPSRQWHKVDEAVCWPRKELLDVSNVSVPIHKFCNTILFASPKLCQLLHCTTHRSCASPRGHLRTFIARTGLS